MYDKIVGKNIFGGQVCKFCFVSKIYEEDLFLRLVENEMDIL